MPATPPAAARDRHLLFLCTPALWPAWPFLPLVRRRPGRPDDLGLLIDTWAAYGVEGHRSTVFLTNLFLLPPTAADLLAGPREEFASADDVYASGWRVD